MDSQSSNKDLFDASKPYAHNHKNVRIYAIKNQKI